MSSPAGHGAVLYAKDLQRVAQFYRAVFDMRVIANDNVRSDAHVDQAGSRSRSHAVLR